MIKSRRMRWEGHVTCLGEMRNVYIVQPGNLKGIDLFVHVGVDRRIILSWTLKM
jgi:hypothetical protein